MSIGARLRDAEILYRARSLDGALLSVIIAVAATSRKRYPRACMNDRQSFEEFIHDEMMTITGGVIRNLNVLYRGELRPVQEVLYKFLRCELVHEASIPNDFVLEAGPGLKVQVDETRVVFSQGILDGLIRAVVRAPENRDELRDWAAACETQVKKG